MIIWYNIGTAVKFGGQSADIHPYLIIYHVSMRGVAVHFDNHYTKEVT